jgi:hypothetical protein
MVMRTPSNNQIKNDSTAVNRKILFFRQFWFDLQILFSGPPVISVFPLEHRNQQQVLRQKILPLFAKIIETVRASAVFGDSGDENFAKISYPVWCCPAERCLQYRFYTFFFGPRWRWYTTKLNTNAKNLVLLYI